jgi:acid phosphatase (class A)
MSKKSILLLIAATMLSSSVVCAQKYKNAYLTAEEVPNAVYWLPAPPAPGSSQFMADIAQYFWGKQQRQDSLRAQKAIREVAFETDEMVPLFSEVFGMEISPKTSARLTPMPRMHYSNSVTNGDKAVSLPATIGKAMWMPRECLLRHALPVCIPAKNFSKIWKMLKKNLKK